MMRLGRWLLTAALLPWLASCGPAGVDQARVDEAEADFGDAMSGLQDEFGQDGKADLFGVDPCHFLTPLFDAGNDFTRAGFFVGVEGEGVLGVTAALGGYDLVWDLYHHQMSVSRYFGAGVSTPKIGASVSAYAGFAVGFEHGAADWDGYFVTTGMDVGLPFLKDYLSLVPAVFVSGVDRDGDHLIAPGEVLVPPAGVYGFEIGVSLGFDLLPDPLPVGVEVTEGLWEPYKPAIRHYYDRLASTRFAKLGTALRVYLVDHETGAECAPDWPDVDGERDCVIEFGERDWSHAHRGAHVAYAICSSLGGCEIPLSWPMSATAVAIGAYRDVGDTVQALCPELGASAPH
jgi:hypothetical protein